MIEDVIIDIDNFSSVYEITLQAIPNQEFSTTINNEIFNIEVRTFANDRTYITIKKDDVTLCNNANIKCGVDITYFGGIRDFRFFFLKQNDKQDIQYNYADFNKNIGLCCGVI